MMGGPLKDISKEGPLNHQVRAELAMWEEGSTQLNKARSIGALLRVAPTPLRP